MKINGNKCHLSVSSSENASIRVDEYGLRKSEYENLLGVKFDTKLNIWKLYHGYL